MKTQWARGGAIRRMRGWRLTDDETRRRVQIEAGLWGALTAIHTAFFNPVLVARDAGPLALGLFNSGANICGYGAGFLGPRLAARAGNAARVTLLALSLGRLLFLGVPLLMVITGDGAVPALIVVVLLWTLCEGVALPLWVSMLAGAVDPSQRGAWLAMRATAAAGATVVVLFAIVVASRFLDAGNAFNLAYAVAAMAGVGSILQLRRLIPRLPAQPAPTPGRLLAMPPAGEYRRFLGGVFCFWFGAGLIWPILPPFIINDLGAPPAYFGLIAVLQAVIAFMVQRAWGRMGDQQGARKVLGRAGLGTSIVPVFWVLAPTYWIGPLVEIVASACWPGHMLGLTLRSVELADDERQRPMTLAWTSLAQGTGASVSPLIASLLVGWTGVAPLLVVAAIVRLSGTVLIGEITLPRLPLDRVRRRRRSRNGP